MSIPLSTPVSQPAANYTAWWIKSITINAPSPTATASARVIINPYDPTNGIMQSGESKMFVINDLFGAASADPTTGEIVGAAITGIIAAVQAVAGQQNLL